jgi:parvulin-like peptidyl-prolyl isomerase
VLASVLLLVCSGCVVSTYGGPSSEPEIPLPPQKTRAETNESTPSGPAEIGASHILISYKGAMRAAPYIKRTKEEAAAFAAELHEQLVAGAEFAKLAEQHSDDPGSAADGGSLGVFSRTQMVKEFSDAAFVLDVGGVSQVVESPFGFHIILRTQ